MSPFLRAIGQAALAVTAVGLFGAPARAQERLESPTLDPEWVSAFHWRSIGPAAAGGRILRIVVVESDPKVWYVSTASGGLWKTTNNGVTFVPLFQHENTISIGDIAVSQSHPDIVWVGTGENNPRNSTSWGDGVYKSTDGGQSWTNMGLRETFQVGRIAVHPDDPDVVYVGALGRLWGPNEERGVFKTIPFCWHVQQNRAANQNISGHLRPSGSLGICKIPLRSSQFSKICNSESLDA